MGESSRKYENGKIYCIRNWVDDEIYVGHTTQSLSKRLQKHRSDCKNKSCNYPLYQKMRELGMEQFYIELLQKCPCDDIDELRSCEGDWTRKMGTLNRQIAGRTQQQYNLDTAERRQEYIKQYQKENKERKKEYDKNYRKEKKLKNPEQGKENWEKKKEYFLETLECECGASVARQGMSRHLRTIKHQNFLNNNIDVSSQEKDQH